MVKPIFEVDDLDPEPVAEVEENKFYKTTFTIEVLSEGTPIECTNLQDLHAAITDGPFSGLVETVTTEEMTSTKAAAELIQQGSDPGFFGLEEFDQDARKLIDRQKAQRFARIVFENPVPADMAREEAAGLLQSENAGLLQDHGVLPDDIELHDKPYKIGGYKDV